MVLQIFISTLELSFKILQSQFSSKDPDGISFDAVKLKVFYGERANVSIVSKQLRNPKRIILFNQNVYCGSTFDSIAESDELYGGSVRLVIFAVNSDLITNARYADIRS